MIKRIFVSDIHMSLGGHPYDWLSSAEAQAFEQFLDYVAKDGTIDELVLVGDMADDWIYPLDVQPPSYAAIAAAHPGIITRLVAASQGKPVTYLVGNHDITITKNSIPNFGNGTGQHVIFQWSYDVDGLWAEHGNQYVVWNALDPKNKLPIGHYISRLQATVDNGVGHPARWQEAISDILHNIDATIENPYVNIVLDYFVARLGIDEDTTIVTTEGDTITIRDVRNLYADLSERWKKGDHDFPGLVDQFLMEEGPDGLRDIARFTAARRKKKVVIFGHTHEWKIEKVYTWDDGPRGPENIHEAIYANCGAWCKGHDLTYVMDEYDENVKKHTVSVMSWPAKKPVKPPLSIS